MANLFITEFSGISHVGSASVQAPRVPPVASQTVVFSGSTQSAAMNSSTELVMITASAAAHLVFGDNPTATVAGMYIPANIPIFVATGRGMKIAAIAAA